MALILKPKNAPVGQSPAQSDPPQHQNVSWLKTGQAKKAAYEHEEAKAQDRAEDAKKMFRFYSKVGEETQITFLDGDLDSDGHLNCPVTNEHTVMVGGERKHFICTEEDDTSQPCPLCAKGDKPAFIGVLTVLDHKAHTIKNGPNAGKIIQHSRKLFVAKRTTLALLANKAKKNGGSLKFCTYDVSRQTDRDPSVGNQFDFVNRHANASALAQHYGLKLEDVQPANYQSELKYRSPEELIALGVGQPFSGSPGGPSAQASAAVKNEL